MRTARNVQRPEDMDSGCPADQLDGVRPDSGREPAGNLRHRRIRRPVWVRVNPWQTCRCCSDPSRADGPCSAPSPIRAVVSGWQTSGRVATASMSERDGYVDQQYGQVSSARPGTVLLLEPGQEVRDVVISLEPTGTISGQIFDEAGEPLEGVTVRALWYDYEDGEKVLSRSRSAETNDLGEYRLYWLIPDEYYVSADLRRPLSRIENPARSCRQVGSACPACWWDTGCSAGTCAGNARAKLRRHVLPWGPRSSPSFANLPRSRHRGSSHQFHPSPDPRPGCPGNGRRAFLSRTGCVPERDHRAATRCNTEPDQPSSGWPPE